MTPDLRARLAAGVGALLLAGLPGCDGSGVARVKEVTAGVGALNQPLMLALDGPVDPLSVTSRSVRVTREDDGRPLACRVDVVDGALAVLLEVDAALLADPPSAAVLTLAGGPSPHALTCRDGRRLGARARHRVPLRPELRAGTPGPPRLVEPVDPTQPLDPPLTLVFEGPLDPLGVTAAACPVFPLAGGLALEPVPTTLTWRCLGQRFEVRLEWPRPHGELRLDLRRCGWRGLGGDAPVPAPRLTVAAGSR